MTARPTLSGVDGRRLLDRLDELAAVGATPGGGVTRLAYSPEDVRARELVAGWLADAGLAVTVDPAGNLVGRLPGTGPAAGTLATGSHLDSVVDAGRLDGVYGVVAAVAVAEALRRDGVRLRHDLAVIAFSNEEGARGTPGMVGSQAIAGRLTSDDLARPDDEGVPLADRLAAAGGDPGRIEAAAWPPGEVAGFLELHVEQGPVLRAEGARIGVVTGITGRANADILVRGLANHAGTTPMVARQDAAVAAADLVLAVRRLATDGHVRVATTGLVQVSPGVRNVVPGEALLGVDLRDLDDERITHALDLLDTAAAEIGATRHVSVEVRRGPSVPAVRTDPRLAGCVAGAADRLGLTRIELPSGAGHDAQVMAGLGPIGMIFVPSVDGISHSPRERTDPDDLVAGADVLLHALLAADGELDPE
ncbi:Zn-dependent hydrolase [Gandjariella thermophila]|uniref:Zn-dependent hydrolase n=1 Tax=Gandjariella thermophila TaxID=1931992 RepID=A0A4D4J6Z8_9PSEU|nr:Zn-dependent hydrolase [Gandjariella thermophila]GDY29727.1 Zn-dependent hydrolase [Gandjariella thermophila]